LLGSRSPAVHGLTQFRQFVGVRCLFTDDVHLTHMDGGHGVPSGLIEGAGLFGCWRSAHGLNPQSNLHPRPWNRPYLLLVPRHRLVLAGQVKCEIASDMWTSGLEKTRPGGGWGGGPALAAIRTSDLSRA
jgi:hypothetical protein